MLTVNASGIQDEAGNFGTGSMSTSWLMDTTPPTSTVDFAAAATTSTSFTRVGQRHRPGRLERQHALGHRVVRHLRVEGRRALQPLRHRHARRPVGRLHRPGRQHLRLLQRCDRQRGQRPAHPDVGPGRRPDPRRARLVGPRPSPNPRNTAVSFGQIDVTFSEPSTSSTIGLTSGRLRAVPDQRRCPTDTVRAHSSAVWPRSRSRAGGKLHCRQRNYSRRCQLCLQRCRPADQRQSRLSSRWPRPPRSSHQYGHRQLAGQSATFTATISSAAGAPPDGYCAVPRERHGLRQRGGVERQYGVSCQSPSQREPTLSRHIHRRHRLRRQRCQPGRHSATLNRQLRRCPPPPTWRSAPTPAFPVAALPTRARSLFTGTLAATGTTVDVFDTSAPNTDLGNATVTGHLVQPGPEPRGRQSRAARAGQL